MFVMGTLFVAGAAAAAASCLLAEQRSLWVRHATLEAGQIPWVVFLKDGADRAPVEETLRILPGLQSLRFISKEEALESAKADPAFSDGLALTGGNPFPESFVVEWSPLFVRGDLLEGHARRVAALPGVDHVDYDHPRAERYSLVQKTLSELDLAAETLTVLTAGLLLALVGRLLFFPRGPFPAVALATDAAAAGAGAAIGLLAARYGGLAPGLSPFLAGWAASGVLAVGRHAL